VAHAVKVRLTKGDEQARDLSGEIWEVIEEEVDGEGIEAAVKNFKELHGIVDFGEASIMEEYSHSTMQSKTCK
jgi:hypothetical protein